MESESLEDLRDYTLIADSLKNGYQYRRYKIQIDQQNILPVNVVYVRLLLRPLDSQYCYLQLEIKWCTTNTKPQAYCFIRFMLMITEIIKVDEIPPTK